MAPRFLALGEVWSQGEHQQCVGTEGILYFSSVIISNRGGGSLQAVIDGAMGCGDLDVSHEELLRRTEFDVSSRLGSLPSF